MKFIVVNGCHLKDISLLHWDGVGTLRHFGNDLPRLPIRREASRSLWIEPVFGLRIADGLAVQSEDDVATSVVKVAFCIDDCAVHWDGDVGAGEVVLRFIL